MTRSSSRSPFQTETSSPADGLEDKSADHGVEVKDLDADQDDDDVTASVLSIPDSPLPVGENAPANEPAGTVIETVPVVMIHHYKEHVPGKTVVLDQRTATSWVTAHIARWPKPDEQV